MLSAISNHIRKGDSSVRTIVKEILSNIESGYLYPGYQFPLVQEQAAIFQVSRYTINRVMRELLTIGAVVSEKKRIYVNKQDVDMLQLDFGQAHPLHVREFDRLFVSRSRSVDKIPMVINRRMIIEQLYLDKYRNSFPGSLLDSNQACLFNSWSMAMLLIGRHFPGRTIVVDGIIESPITRALSLCSDDVVLLGDQLAGLDLHHFRELCRSGKVSLLVFSPRVRCPFGIPMREQVLQELLEIVRQYGVPLLEVDLFEDMWFSDTPYEPVSFRAMQQGIKAIYVRPMAYLPIPFWSSPVVIGEAGFIQQLRMERLWLEVDFPQFETGALDLLHSKDFTKRIAGIRQEYQVKRDYLFSRFMDIDDREFSVTLPMGGLSFWIGLPPEVSRRDFGDALRQLGIAVPVHYYFAKPGENYHGIKLGFGSLDKPMMNKVAQSIHAAVTRVIKTQRPKRRA